MRINSSTYGSESSAKRNTHRSYCNPRRGRESTKISPMWKRMNDKGDSRLSDARRKPGEELKSGNGRPLRQRREGRQQRRSPREASGRAWYQPREVHRHWELQEGAEFLLPRQEEVFRQHEDLESREAPEGVLLGDAVLQNEETRNMDLSFHIRRLFLQEFLKPGFTYYRRCRNLQHLSWILVLKTSTLEVFRGSGLAL